MKNAVLLGAAVIGLVAAACSPQSSDVADVVFVAAGVYAPDIDDARAVAVRGDEIVFVGSEADAAAWRGRATRLVELPGAYIYPGFTDAHAHLVGIGMREMTLNLEGVDSLARLVEIVSEEASRAGSGETISGRGWIETRWPEGRFPTRRDLDAAAPNNPVILRRADGHALVANSAALELAGVTRATIAPDGGDILKDAAGEPTGMLIDAAMGLVSALIDAPSAAQKETAYITGAQVYAAYGWTGLHNMSVDPEDVALIERLSDEGRLPIRVYNSVDIGGAEDLFADGPRVNENGRVVTRSIKLYADGALGSRGAALLEPYADADTSGLLFRDRDDMLPLFSRALAAGVQINTHAIGDRANRLVLDWYEEAFAAAAENEIDVTDVRWRIEHAQIIDPADIPRFAELSVIASMQPSHAIGDLHFAPARLGSARLEGAYAWRSLIDAAAVIAGGSDAPVERGDPRIEYYAAVARKDLEGFSTPDWRPEQAVTRDEAIAMFTVSPAYASFQDDRLGVIAPGMAADLTIFAGDLTALAEDEIPGLELVMTVVGGDVVYSSLGE